MGDSEQQHKPIFYDATSRRATVVGVISHILTLCAVLGALLFLLTIAHVPLPNVSITRAPGSRAPRSRGLGSSTSASRRTSSPKDCGV